MNDDFNLDDLKSQLNDATPMPDAQRRAENIALATKNFADLQGSRQQPRPTFRSNIWTRTKTMLKALTSRGALTTTTAIIACGFIFITPVGREWLNFDPATTAKTDQAPNVEEIALSEPAAEPITPPPSPAIEPELNDLATDLETSAVQALEALQAPAPVIEETEPAANVTDQMQPQLRADGIANREIVQDVAPTEQSPEALEIDLSLIHI